MIAGLYLLVGFFLGMGAVRNPSVLETARMYGPEFLALIHVIIMVLWLPLIIYFALEAAYRAI